MQESGFVQSVYTEAEAEIINVYTMPTKNKPSINYQLSHKLLAFDQPEIFFSSLSTKDSLQYSKLWDESMFSKVWTKEEITSQGIPAIFPDSFLKNFGLEKGNIVSLAVKTGGGNSMVYPYKVIGTYVEGVRQNSNNFVKTGGDAILIPLSVLRILMDNNLYFTTANFIIDPAKNRELTTFKEEMQKIVSEPSAGKLPLQIVFWDEELRSVVEPLEKSLSLLQVLYPVTLLTAMLIGIGLNLLLVLQSAKDAAILRILGTPLYKVRAMYLISQLLLTLWGILIGFIGLYIIQKETEVLLEPQVILASGLILCGTIIGAFLGALLITNKNPLGLLQVKE